MLPYLSPLFSRLSTRRAGVFLPPPHCGPLAGSVAFSALCAIMFAVADPDVAGLDFQDLPGSVRAEANGPHDDSRDPGPEGPLCARATGNGMTQYWASSAGKMLFHARPPWPLLDILPIHFRFAARVDSRLSDFFASAKGFGRRQELNEGHTPLLEIKPLYCFRSETPSYIYRSCD